MGDRSATVQTARGPNGEDMVLLSRDKYEDLLDARRHEAAMRAVASSVMDLLSEQDAVTYLAAKTPLAFWRRHRQMTQQALAEAIGVSQAYIAQIENGMRCARCRSVVRAAASTASAPASESFWSMSTAPRRWR